MLELVDVQKNAQEVLATIQSADRSEFTTGMARKFVLDKVAEEHGLTGMGAEASSNPYPYNLDTEEDTPIEKEGFDPLFEENANIVYRQVFRLKRPL